MKQIILLVILVSPFLAENAGASAKGNILKALAKIFLIESADDGVKAAGRGNLAARSVVETASHNVEVVLVQRLEDGLNDPILLVDMVKEMIDIDDSNHEDMIRATAIAGEVYSRCSAVQVTFLPLENGDPDAFMKMQKFISYKAKHQYSGMLGMEIGAASDAAIRDHEYAVAWYQDSMVGEGFVSKDKSVCDLLLSSI